MTDGTTTSWKSWSIFIVLFVGAPLSMVVISWASDTYGLVGLLLSGILAFAMLVAVKYLDQTPKQMDCETKKSDGSGGRR